MIFDKVDPNMKLDGEPLVLATVRMNQKICRMLLENSNLKIDSDLASELFHGFKKFGWNKDTFLAFFGRCAQNLCTKNSKGEILLKKIIENETEEIIRLCLEKIDPNTKLDGVPIISIAVQREVRFDSTTEYTWLEEKYTDDTGEVKQRVMRSVRPKKIGNTPIVRVFIEKKADPNAKDEYGNTPLHYAVKTESIQGYEYGRVDILGELLKNGADQNIPDSIGLTPLAIMIIKKLSGNYVLSDPLSIGIKNADPSDDNLEKCALLFHSAEDPRFKEIENIWKKRHPDRKLRPGSKTAPAKLWI
jgi:predicted nucleic acid binding AN1-type Zn finger protein